MCNFIPLPTQVCLVVCLWTFLEGKKLFIICTLTRDNIQRKEKTVIVFKKKKNQLIDEVHWKPQFHRMLIGRSSVYRVRIVLDLKSLSQVLLHFPCIMVEKPKPTADDRKKKARMKIQYVLLLLSLDDLDTSV